MLLVIFMLLASQLKMSAQGLVDTPSEKLIRQIRQSNADTGRVKFLLALSKQLILRSGAAKPQIDSAYALEKQAEGLSRATNDLKHLGRSVLMAAMIENKKGNSNKGLKLSQQALAYFQRIKAIKDEAEANIIIGQHYEPAGSGLPKIINYYQNAVNLFRQAGEKERLATTLVDIADFQQANNNSTGSLKNLTLALKVYQAIGYKKLTNIYDLIGQNLLILGDKEDALNYQLLAERSALAAKDSSLQLCTVYNRLSDCYVLLKQYRNALSYSKKSLAIANKFRDTGYIFVSAFSLARIYYLLQEPKKSILIASRIRGWYDSKSDTTSMIYYNSLFVKDYTDLKQFANARIYLGNIPAYSGPNVRLSTEMLIAHIYYLLGTKQYKACYPYLKFGKRVTTGVSFQKDAAKNELYWFKVDSALGKFQDALQHYQRNRRLSDSVFSLAKDNRVAFLQIQFETEKKEQQLSLQAKSIELLRNSAALANQKQNARLSILAGILTITLVILGFGYSRYRLKQRSNLLLETKQNEIHRSNVLLQGLVTEKDWLLKEVHHRVKNNLQIIMSLLSSQSAYLENTAAIEAIRESQNRVQAISLIHQKLYKSSNVASIDMPVYVTDLLEYLADSFDTPKRHIRFEKVIEAFNLDLAQAVPLGLILNESVTNAIKYAFGSDGGQIIVALQLIKDENMLLTIADNGKGFPGGLNLQESNTLGMEMMKALSKQLGGEFRIENKAGVRISIEFAIEKMVFGHSADESVHARH